MYLWVGEEGGEGGAGDGVGTRERGICNVRVQLNKAHSIGPH